MTSVPLNSTHFLVAFLRELALHSNHSFETRIKIRDAQLKELWQFANELVVQDVKNFLSVIIFLLGLCREKDVLL
jgi:hypothetical protein